jgi:energy-coupling factor transporter ATP-binding protein EcfA2
MRTPTLLGAVESTTGSTVTVGLDDETLSGLVYIDGQGYRIGQVGSFVRIPQGFANLFGLVTQAGVAAAPREAAPIEQSRRWLTVEIVGEGRTGQPFSRGVYRYPTIGDEVHLVTEQDLAFIYGSSTSREHIEIGSLSSGRSIPAHVDVNKLVTRHCAVLGATGSGKSTTVSSLVGQLSNQSRLPGARILMLDIHGEYAPAFPDSAQIFRVNPDSQRGEQALHIPFWALNFDELLPLTFGSLGDNERGRVIDWITERKRAQVQSGAFPGVEPDWISVDTPLPFSLMKLWHELRWEIDATYPRNTTQVVGAGGNSRMIDPGDAEQLRPARFEASDGTNIIQSKSLLAIRKQLDSLASRMRDPRLKFLFDPGPWGPDAAHQTAADLDDLLARWLGDGSPTSRPITILDLSGIPASVLTDLVGALLRLLFDALFWGRKLSEGGRERPLLIVMEEAHSYLCDPKSVAAVAAKRIVKEGRKYGLGAMIVSQRPAEIDQTILSQCGTFVALRMSNTVDRNHIAAATSDSLRGMIDLLPTLRVGEAIVVGEAVHLPIRTTIHAPPENRRPSSDDPRLVEVEFAPGEPGPGGWDRKLEPSTYADLVLAWRRQDPASPKTIKTKE